MERINLPSGWYFEKEKSSSMLFRLMTPNSIMAIGRCRGITARKFADDMNELTRLQEQLRVAKEALETISKSCALNHDTAYSVMEGAMWRSMEKSASTALEQIGE